MSLSKHILPHLTSKELLKEAYSQASTPLEKSLTEALEKEINANDKHTRVIDDLDSKLRELEK
jgi:hypothetical protein